MQSFAELFEQSLKTVDLKSGSLVKATVVAVLHDRVIVNAGLKTEGVIPSSEFSHEKVQPGDMIEVVIEAADNGFGETRLSHEKAKRAKSWGVLEKAHQANESIRGTIIERVKGGFTVQIDSIRAFLPGSLVDVKPVRDPGYLEGKELDFKIIKMDQKRNNLVVSRRAVMEAESTAERRARLGELQEGQEVVGVVKNITDYGAFIDLGGIDGLLHITDIAWKRVKHPSEILNVGDEIKVKVLKFDREKNRVSLGLKQMGEDPWENIERRYPVNTRVTGHVTNITDYGCFVQLEEGVEGLVHMSEMDWTNKNVHPSKVVQSGEEVEVEVLEIDGSRRRISLGIKQCKMNPWAEFSQKHQKDERISGKIRSITDFGMFVGLDGGIDGLIHLSDISWQESGEEAVKKYKKGDEVEAVILAIDPERERISLGVKQLEGDPVTEFLEKQDKDAVFKGVIKEVEAKVAAIELAENVVGHLRPADYSQERIKDLTEVLNVGDTLEVKVLGLDRKTRQIQLSHKAINEPTSSRSEKETRANLDVPTKTTLGDLLKEQMQNKED